MLLSSWGLHVGREAGEAGVNQPAADPVQHLESVAKPALFRAIPFQTVGL